MTTRNRKCSDLEISMVVNEITDIETDDDSFNKSSELNINTKNQRESRIRISRDIINESQKQSVKKNDVPLRITLRRSTEQSSYKIKRDLSNRRKDIPKTVMKIKNKNEISSKEISTPRSASRIIKTPKKLEDCDISGGIKIRKTPKTNPSCNTNKNETPSGRTFRSRKNINYNIDQHYNNIDFGETKQQNMSRKENKPCDSGLNVIDQGTPKKQKKIMNECEADDSDSCMYTATPTKQTKITHNIEERIEVINTPRLATKIKNKKKNSDEDDSDFPYSPIKTRRGLTRRADSPVRSRTPLREKANTANKCQFTPKNNKIVEMVENFQNHCKLVTPTKNRMSGTPCSSKKQTSKIATEEVDDADVPQRLARMNLNTPKSRRSIKCSALTPSVSKRLKAITKPSTPLQEAKAKLHVSVVPKSLPCREAEFNDIYTFLERKLVEKSGGCIYISGVPGTGKTATVNEVIKCLKRLTEKGKIDPFDYVEINGMKLSEPRQVYVQVLKQLTGNCTTWEHAQKVLEKRFSTKRISTKMTLLLVDELDLLCTKRQDVVYNLLDWPAKTSAQLVVITIANTMDLPERVLMGRVTSRLGLTRLTFQPYNHKQLQEIVISRLKCTETFRSEAIQLVARKVSAVSGDARRALDICRRATEVAEARGAEIVSMADVNEALTEMIASVKVQAIKHCSEMEQMFLQAVSAEITRTGVEEACFNNVIHQLESICSFNGIKMPTCTEVLSICARLGANRLLISEHSRADIYQRILLNVSTDDIHYALQITVT